MIICSITLNFHQSSFRMYIYIYIYGHWLFTNTEYRLTAYSKGPKSCLLKLKMLWPLKARVKALLGWSFNIFVHSAVKCKRNIITHYKERIKLSIKLKLICHKGLWRKRAEFCSIDTLNVSYLTCRIK